MVIIIGISMMVPAAVDLYYGNPDWKIFAQASITTIGLGGMACLACRSDIGPRVTARQGYVLTVVSWIAVSVTPIIFSRALRLGSSVSGPPDSFPVSV